MPFLADEELLDLEFVRSDLIQSDILNSVDAAPGYAGEAANDSGVGPSVVAIEEDHQLDHEAEAYVDVGAKEQTMPTPVLKKRGRPSLSRSQTPAKPPAAKTPRSTKKVATPKSAGLQRKAPEPEEQDDEEEGGEEPEAAEEPAKKRGRPAARAAAVVTSTRLSASKPTRGRPKSTTTTSTEAAAKPTKGKGGRPKKEDTNGDSIPADEYEVESIVDAAVDAISKEHMYLVKWKGYPSSQNTWEPKKNLSHALDLLKAFDDKNQVESDKTDATAFAAKRQKRETKAAGKAKAEKATGKVAEAPKKAVGRPKRTRSG